MKKLKIIDFIDFVQFEQDITLKIFTNTFIRFSAKKASGNQ